jgi:hypothetical protein
LIRGEFREDREYIEDEKIKRTAFPFLAIFIGRAQRIVRIDLVGRKALEKGVSLL